MKENCIMNTRKNLRTEEMSRNLNGSSKSVNTFRASLSPRTSRNSASSETVQWLRSIEDRIERIEKTLDNAEDYICAYLDSSLQFGGGSYQVTNSLQQSSVVFGLEYESECTERDSRRHRSVQSKYRCLTQRSTTSAVRFSEANTPVLLESFQPNYSHSFGEHMKPRGHRPPAMRSASERPCRATSNNSPSTARGGCNCSSSTSNGRTKN